MPMHSPSRRLLLCFFAYAPLATRAVAQDQPDTLRPGEAIAVPGGSIQVLGMEVVRGTVTRATFRLRAIASAQKQLLISNDTFRLFAAGVPRAPVEIRGDQGSGSFLVEKESAVDFVLSFSIADKTDDLVLQIRFGDAVERRRLPAR